MTSTTGTTVEGYLAWVKQQLEKKTYGEVGIHFKIYDGKVTDVRKESVDTEHYQLPRKEVK